MLHRPNLLVLKPTDNKHQFGPVDLWAGDTLTFTYNFASDAMPVNGVHISRDAFIKFYRAAHKIINEELEPQGMIVDWSETEKNFDG